MWVAGGRSRGLITGFAWGIATVLLLALVVAFAFQRSLIYPVGAAAPPPAVGATAGYEDIVLVTADGLRLRALYRPARPGLPTLVFFHGNADSLSGGVVAMRPMVVAGNGALIPEYRGYAGQPGSPSEKGLYADGAAALEWLERAGVAASDIVIVGNSLGSGVAVETARRCRGCRALVVVSGFTSMPDVVADTFGIGLLRWLVLDRYDNLAKLPDIGLPVLILHGGADPTIAVAQGIALAGAAGRRATLQLYPGARHDLMGQPEAGATIVAWLGGRARPTAPAAPAPHPAPTGTATGPSSRTAPGRR